MKKKFNIPLINTHTHAAMVNFRSKAEDLPLDIWLKDYIWPMEAKLVNANFVYINTKKAIKEMKRNKIAAFCDMYFFEDMVAKAAIEEKIYVTIGETLLDFPTPSFKSPDLALTETKRLYKKYLNNPYVKVSVAPHSIYATSKKTLIKAKKLACKLGLIYQIHLAETKKEFDECQKKWQMTPVEYLDSLNILDNKTLLHHCVWVTENDIKIIAKRKTNIAHCPLSNLKLGSGIAPINKMLTAGINISLGTDGAASSNRLDIWEAGKIAALLQKGVNYNPSLLSTKQIITMMSINGMTALHYDKIENKTIKTIKEYISREKNFNYLYHKLTHEI